MMGAAWGGDASPGVAEGFLTASEAAHLSAEEVLMLVCRPGFSTTTRVTASSGRGSAWMLSDKVWNSWAGT